MEHWDGLGNVLSARSEGMGFTEDSLHGNNANITCLHVCLADVKGRAKVSRTKSLASQGYRKPTARDHSQAPVSYSHLGLMDGQHVNTVDAS